MYLPQLQTQIETDKPQKMKKYTLTTVEKFDQIINFIKVCDGLSHEKREEYIDFLCSRRDYFKNKYGIGKNAGDKNDNKSHILAPDFQEILLKVYQLRNDWLTLDNVLQILIANKVPECTPRRVAYHSGVLYKKGYLDRKKYIPRDSRNPRTMYRIKKTLV